LLCGLTRRYSLSKHLGLAGVCELAVKVAERRADELLAEAGEAEGAPAESLRRQSQSPLEAKIEAFERAVAYQGAELAKLRGPQTARLPALPHTPRAEVPQFLGMPRGMGRGMPTLVCRVPAAGCGRSVAALQLQRPTRALRTGNTRWT
jgi:hypothetical protein